MSTRPYICHTIRLDAREKREVLLNAERSGFSVHGYLRDILMPPRIPWVRWREHALATSPVVEHIRAPLADVSALNNFDVSHAEYVARQWGDREYKIMCGYLDFLVAPRQGSLRTDSIAVTISREQHDQFVALASRMGVRPGTLMRWLALEHTSTPTPPGSPRDGVGRTRKHEVITRFIDLADDALAA